MDNIITGFSVASSLCADLDYPVSIKGCRASRFNKYEQVLYLTPKVMDGTSPTAIAVAAHEAGHAMQYTIPFVSWIMNVVSWGRPSLRLLTSIWYGTMLGMFIGKASFSATTALTLSRITLIAFTVCFLVSLLNLLFEAHASIIAVRQLLKHNHLISNVSMGKCKLTLVGAWLTYFGGCCTTVIFGITTIAMIATMMTQLVV